MFLGTWYVWYISGEVIRVLKEILRSTFEAENGKQLPSHRDQIFPGNLKRIFSLVQKVSKRETSVFFDT